MLRVTTLSHPTCKSSPPNSRRIYEGLSHVNEIPVEDNVESICETACAGGVRNSAKALGSQYWPQNHGVLPRQQIRAC